MGIRKFNRIFFVYMVIETALIFAIAERECMVYRYETDRMYKIILSTVGCLIAILFNIYTMYKTSNMNWRFKVLFRIFSYVINLYSVVLLFYLYIPIINGTDQYILGHFKAVQDNLLIIFLLQWVKINIVGNYLKKAEEVQQTLRRQRAVMTIYCICLFWLFALMVTFGWCYEKEIDFITTSHFNKKIWPRYSSEKIPESEEKIEHLQYSTRFDKKSVLLFSCEKEGAIEYMECLRNGRSEGGSDYSYGLNNVYGNPYLKDKMVKEELSCLPYNMKGLKNIEEFQVFYFTVGVDEWEGRVYTSGVLYNEDKHQVIHFYNENKRVYKAEEWMEEIKKYKEKYEQ